MSDDDTLAGIRASIAKQVAGAFNTADEIVESVTELADEELEDDQPRPPIREWVEQAIREAKEAERGWPEVTDCDRLDRAFERLEAGGIVARQDFTCCQTCGHAEIGDPIAEAKKLRPVLGYTFYHWQDTEAAVEGEGLHLAYGTAGETPAVEIGRRIEAALREEGLRPDWSGEIGQRIHVPLTWQRRRPPDPPPIVAVKPWWQFWK